MAGGRPDPDGGPRRGACRGLIPTTSAAPPRRPASGRRGRPRSNLVTSLLRKAEPDVHTAREQHLAANRRVRGARGSYEPLRAPASELCLRQRPRLVLHRDATSCPARHLPPFESAQRQRSLRGRLAHEVAASYEAAGFDVGRLVVDEAWGPRPVATMSAASSRSSRRWRPKRATPNPRPLRHFVPRQPPSGGTTPQSGSSPSAPRSRSRAG
jgi:hypothetical protein